MENSLKEPPRYDLWFTDDFGYKIPANSSICEDGDWVKYDEYDDLKSENLKLTQEVQRLRDINYELVETHNTLVIENARQERAIWKFSGDPRAFKER